MRKKMQKCANKKFKDSKTPKKSFKMRKILQKIARKPKK